jgi:hypothetical protein
MGHRDRSGEAPFLRAVPGSIAHAIKVLGKSKLFKLGFDPPIVYEPVGRCIYCDDFGSDELGKEHIIPRSLNGTQILRKASCPKCGGVTSYVDGVVSRGAFLQLRTAVQMKSTEPLPDEFPVVLYSADGREEQVMVDAEIHPSMLVLPVFDMPDLLSGRPPDGNFRFRRVGWMRESVAFDEFKGARGVTAAVETWIKPQQFSRFLAKIAHSYAVARLGFYGFKPFLIDLIHGRNVERAPELVGSEPEIPPPAVGKLHELDLIPHREFVVVRIRLFASSSSDGKAMPVYLVVAGALSAAGYQPQ